MNHPRQVLRDTIDGLGELKRRLNHWHDMKINLHSNQATKERYERRRQAKLKILNKAIAIAEEYDE